MREWSLIPRMCLSYGSVGNPLAYGWHNSLTVLVAFWSYRRCRREFWDSEANPPDPAQLIDVLFESMF